MRLDDGRIYHLELQSSGDASMPWRMLEYYTLISPHYQAPVLQQVLYVGPGPSMLSESIEQDRLKYGYQVIDIRDIDCRVLLGGTVLGKIACLDENTRRDALQRLEILCGLRPLMRLIQREVEKMPISLNLKDNPFFQEAFAEGEEKGRLEGEYLLLSR